MKEYTSIRSQCPAGAVRGPRESALVWNCRRGTRSSEAMSSSGFLGDNDRLDASPTHPSLDLQICAARK